MTDKSQYISPIIDEDELSEADLLNVAGGVGSSPPTGARPTGPGYPGGYPGGGPGGYPGGGPGGYPGGGPGGYPGPPPPRPI